MGTLVSVDSTHFLIQREDQPAALEALRAFVRMCPDDFRSATGELQATTLKAALLEGHWHATEDEHGDLVELVYGGDKVPPNATDDFPMSLFEVLAPFVQHGHLFRTMEGWPALLSHSLGLGKSVYRAREPGVRLEQAGKPPRVQPGQTVVVELTACGYGTHAKSRVTDVSSSHSTQLSYRVETETLNIGDTCRVHVTPDPDARDPAVLYLSMNLDGVDQFDSAVRIIVDAPPEQTDVVHEVVATQCPFDYPNPPSAVVSAANVPAALTRLQRYAARHAGRPGAGFLEGVLAAPDLASALRAAQLEASLDAAGGLLGVRFVGSKLPGYERYLFGLFASLRGLVQNDPWFGLCYGHAPHRQVRIGYDWGEPSRNTTDL